PMPAATGAHGGADAILNEQFYSPTAQPDSLGRAAGHEQGAASILVGIAGVESIKRNQPVNIAELVPLRPDAKKLSELV
ncbi:MAG TPA: gfo/Idh/MocA family oxidoreductase, partial [Candidatus Didemnitutus sp.]|nr:gfo/Idh/MocA family oxidoreductase [Candidatus Didemnitutus sp.]